MGRRFIIFYFAFLPCFSFSQKQANIWYFGDTSGLDFSSGVGVPITGGSLHFNSEGCASICDDLGNLLFYASAEQVWDRNHTVMPNGNGLMGGISSTQGVIIIPKPGSDSLFYVFTLDQFQNHLVNGLRYSIINMCLNNGSGDIISGSKNILLLNGTGEKMAATFHSNGNDIWLVVRKHFTNEFYSFLITSGGISAPVISAVGWNNPTQEEVNAIGQMKISPDGSKLAMGVGNMSVNILQLFDFNNSLGTVTNVIDLPTSIGTGSPYGIAFSPDNTKLYVRGPSPTGLDQFDLSSNNPATIQNSIFHVSATLGYAGTGLQLGNDGRIYAVVIPFIGVIYNPNDIGDNCNFVENAITSNASYTLPSFIDNFQYKNKSWDCTVVDNTVETDSLIIPNVFTPNGDFRNDYFPKNPGGYLFDIKIFNRWGVLIFEDHDNKSGWNGYSSAGNKNSDGTYYYILKATYPSSEIRNFHGFVELISGEK